MTAYYNEIDPSAAAWLRELIKRNLIAPGDVDERSIADVSADDIRGYTQAHLFAGIGVWSYALKQAGWPDDRPVWTGSCPCQPFSAAGKGEGYADERHLWPHWHRLIRECRPAVCFGEQVDAAIRTGWLDDVCLSLESIGYAVGAVSFPACSVGAPHIRQRLYFVADAGRAPRCTKHRDESRGKVGRGTATADSTGARARGRVDGLANAQNANGRRGERGEETGTRPDGERRRGFASDGELGGLADAEWIACRDGKARPTEPGVAPLVTGAAARVVRLRGYGNSINAEAAKEFIEAYMSAA